MSGASTRLPVRARLSSALTLIAWLPALVATGLVAIAGECPEEPPVQNYTGAGNVVCPCFVAGERAGAVLQAPSQHYPIEILRVGIGWGSQFGGAPAQIEEAIRIYGAGLPNPGSPIFSLEGPQLMDGFINTFNLEPIPGEIVIDSGPFTVALEFANANAGNPFAPSTVHDGNGCQPGKNVIFAIPGGWLDGCAAGLSGDWVVFVVYRQVDCLTGVGEELVVSSASARLLRPRPNPFQIDTEVGFVLTRPEQVRLAIHDLAGRRVRVLSDRSFPAGRHALRWDGVGDRGERVAPGVYFLTLDAGSYRAREKIVLH
jgi:hypothetical protein